MASFNGFAIEIIPVDGEVLKYNKEGFSYVGLNDGVEYKIELINKWDVPTDVELELEGKEVGKWRINPHDNILLERPGDRVRKLTFFGETSFEAVRAGVNQGESTNGLVKATFYPQRKQRPIPSAPLSSSLTSGTTLLGGSSNQRFKDIAPLDEIDWHNVTEIYLRLILIEGHSMEGYDRARCGPYSPVFVPRVPPRIEEIDRYARI